MSPIGLKYLPLSVPIALRRGNSQMPFRELLSCTAVAKRANQRLVDVRRQIQQVHDLRQSGSAHLPQPGQFRLVGHDAVAEELVEADGQGHQTGDAGDSF